MNAELKKAYWELHIAVFIFGFTAILGKLISADHFTLVWHRMWLAALGFFLIPRFYHSLKATPIKSIITLLGIGVLVAIHWLTFYGSIKIGKSASLTLGCFGLTSTFTSFLEPIIYKRKLDRREIILGLIALLGIGIIAYYSPSESAEGGNFTLAIIVGVFSTFVAALFSTINSRLTNKIDTKVMSFTELTGGFLFLNILLLFAAPFIGQWKAVLPIHNFNIWPTTLTPQFIHSPYADFIWIAILALVCTNIAFVLNLNAMKKVTAFTANLAINLEPVYGIILAAFILNEHQFLNIQFYIGTAIILSSVVLHSLMKKNGQ
ncbi:MAG: DMT family transporter [bacterium]|nr:DMT family transporter [bacterium]